MMYGFCNMERDNFFVILDRFLPFNPPMDPENQNFGKIKEIPEEIIILQMCTINDSHMMYGSWDMECSGQNFFSLLTVFCSFTKKKKNNPKIKILKKWKNRLKISSLYTNVSKVMIICYTVPVMRCVTDVILIFHFGLFLPFHPPNNPKNKKFRKMKKNSWIYHQFTHVYQK